MSYTPNTWQTGDTVTAEKLNHMETGIDNVANPFIVTLTPTAQDYSGVTDRSNREVYDAYVAGRQIVAALNLGTEVEIIPAYVTVVEQEQKARVETFALTDNLFVLIQQFYSGEPQAPYGTTIYPLTPMS